MYPRTTGWEPLDYRVTYLNDYNITSLRSRCLFEPLGCLRVVFNGASGKSQMCFIKYRWCTSIAEGKYVQKHD